MRRLSSATGGAPSRWRRPRRGSAPTTATCSGSAASTAAESCTRREHHQTRCGACCGCLACACRLHLFCNVRCYPRLCALPLRRPTPRTRGRLSAASSSCSRPAARRARAGLRTGTAPLDGLPPLSSLQAAAKRKVADAEAEAAVLESMAALDGAADEAATAAAFEALRLSSTATLVEIAQNPKLRAEIADPAAVQVRGCGPLLPLRGHLTPPPRRSSSTRGARRPASPSAATVRSSSHTSTRTRLLWVTGCPRRRRPPLHWGWIMYPPAMAAAPRDRAARRRGRGSSGGTRSRAAAAPHPPPPPSPRSTCRMTTSSSPSSASARRIRAPRSSPSARRPLPGARCSRAPSTSSQRRCS